MVRRRSRLFVGLGNVLRRDDGVGVRAAERLIELEVPADVEVCDAGTGGLGLATWLEGRALVVVADALDADAEPGAIFRFAPVDLRPTERSGLSLHDLHLLDALDELRLLGRVPASTVILGVQVADVTMGIALSPPLEAALDRVVALAARELGLPGPAAPPAETSSAWSR